jgi:hypothetical protein
MVGGTVVALGLALIVLPGPAVLVVPFGVGILATEFAWAQRLSLHIRSLAKRTLDRIKGTTHRRLAPVAVETTASGDRDPSRSN